jgi:hypothetical protein
VHAGDVVMIEAGEWYAFKVTGDEPAVLSFSRWCSDHTFMQQLTSLKFAHHKSSRIPRLRWCMIRSMKFPNNFKHTLENSIRRAYGADIVYPFSFDSNIRTMSWILREDLFLTFNEEQKKMKYLGNLTTLSRYMRLWRSKSSKELSVLYIDARCWGRATLWAKAHMGTDTFQDERYVLHGPPKPHLAEPEAPEEDVEEEDAEEVISEAESAETLTE